MRNFVVDELIIGFNMFGASMKTMINGYIGSTNIITPKHKRSVERYAELK